MNNTTRAAIVHALLLPGLAAAACDDRLSFTGPTATVSVAVTANSIDQWRRLRHRASTTPRRQGRGCSTVRWKATGATPKSGPCRCALCRLSPMNRDGLGSQGSSRV